MTIHDALDLLLVQALIIWGVDCTDFMDSVKRQIGIWTGWEPRRLKPFDCSLCASFWGGVIFIAVTGLPWQAVGIAALTSHLSKWVAAFLRAVLNLLLAINEKFNKFIDKIWQTKTSD